MNYENFYRTYGHSYEEYERSHKTRLDFLVEDLNLNNVTGRIAELGCGLGFLYNRLIPRIQDNYVGFDGAEINYAPFIYYQVDLDTFKGDAYGVFDVAFCFETLEHLTNPYNCLLAAKKMVKEDGLLYLSIPHIECTHNTIYPGLLYPVDNFIEFLFQMAWIPINRRTHDKAFKQEVFILQNKSWEQSRMRWWKSESKFRNIPPHVSVNL